MPRCWIAKCSRPLTPADRKGTLPERARRGNSRPPKHRLITRCGIGGDSQAAKELSIHYTVLNYIPMGMVVDHTTDARRGKLPLYESWGFPEVWVDVPDAPSPSRPRARRPGLTIHLLVAGRFRAAAESHAFPGWTAAEIHEALNEATPSLRTSAVLERVGGVLGAREGTGPDDDPLLRSQRRQEFERGRAEGLIAGVRKARAEEVRQILVSRGIEVSAGFLADAAFAAVPEDVLISAALACEDEAAFRTAISRPDQ